MATLVGCNQSGSFFRIDHATGSGSLVGATGFSGTNSLALDGSGRLYSAPSALITIDSKTGAGTFVTDLQPSSSDIRALAFSPANVLFAIRNGRGPTGTELPDDLVTIDASTGAVTLVGSTGRTGLQALAFSPRGTLYGWDLHHGLTTIDPAIGDATLVNPGVVPGSVVDLQSLAFAANGTLYGAREQLYTIDASTGAATLVGSGGYTDLRGIEFVDDHGAFRPPPILRLAWLWTVLVGFILITPIGPICIACEEPIADPWVRLLGALTMAVGAVGFWNESRTGRSDR